MCGVSTVNVAQQRKKNKSDKGPHTRNCIAAYAQHKTIWTNEHRVLSRHIDLHNIIVDAHWSIWSYVMHMQLCNFVCDGPKTRPNFSLPATFAIDISREHIS